MKSDKISVKELFLAIDDIYEEKGITKEYLIESLKLALEAAYKKNYKTNETIKVDISDQSIKVYAVKEVVENVEDENTQITLENAKKITKRAKIGDVVNIEVTPKNFNRVAAEAGKLILIQRLREAERDLVYTQYADKKGQIVVGVVQNSDKNGTIVDLGKVEAIIPTNKQVKTEKFKSHQRIKAYVEKVLPGGKYGPQIILSRNSPEFVKKLFELEVPEIIDGIVEIKGIARDAGSRTKIAVWSNDENVDPVGSLVGKKGLRIQPIIDELFGEKIDVVPYSDDIPSYIINALSPAPILAIDIKDDEKLATVVVPDEAISYAIGPGGQNVKLAAILTDWRIDIKTEKQIKENIVE